MLGKCNNKSCKHFADLGKQIHDTKQKLEKCKRELFRLREAYESDGHPLATELWGKSIDKSEQEVNSTKHELEELIKRI